MISQRLVPGLLTALFMFCPLPAHGQESVHLKNGNEIKGKIQNVTQEYVMVQISRDQGSTQTQLQVDQIKPTEVLRLWDRFGTLSSPSDQLDAGTFALRNQLFDEARTLFRDIISSSDNHRLVQEAKELLNNVKQKERNTLYEKALQKKKRGQYEEAIALFEKLQKAYPDSNEAQKASRKLKLLAQKIQEQNENEKNENEQEQKAVIQKNVDKITSRIQNAKNDISNGLKQEAKNDLSSALATYKKTKDQLLEAKARLETLQKQHANEVASQKLKNLRNKNKKWLIQTYIQMASLHGRKGRIQRGLSSVNLALSEDPSNTQAQELKMTFIRHLLMRSNLQKLPY